MNCGKRIDIPVGREFPCANCKKKDSLSVYRAIFNFEAIDDLGVMKFTTFTADTEKLFGISAEQIHLIKDSVNPQEFFPIQEKLYNTYVLVQVGPTTALSRNNVLQWCLKGIDIATKVVTTDEKNSIPIDKYGDKGILSSVSDMLDQTQPLTEVSADHRKKSSHTNLSETNAADVMTELSDHYAFQKNSIIPDQLITASSTQSLAQTVISKQMVNQVTDPACQNTLITDSSQKSCKRSSTEEQISKANTDTQEAGSIVPEEFCQPIEMTEIHSIMSENMSSETNYDKPLVNVNPIVTKVSGAVKVHGISVKQEALSKKVNESTGGRVTQKEGSLNALVTNADDTKAAKKSHSELEYADLDLNNDDIS